MVLKTLPIYPLPRELLRLLCLTLITTLSACDGDTSLAPQAGMTGATLATPSDQGAPLSGATEVLDMSPPALDQSLPPQALDMMSPFAGVMGGEMGGEVLGGSPPPAGAVPPRPASCDPRLRAQSCEAGESCWQLPGGEAYQGECVTGDGCDPLLQMGCPTEAPLCQLDGRSTRCNLTPEPPLVEGSPCLTEDNRALPCGEGLICNLSVCVPVCDPRSTEVTCPDERRCVDLSERVGQPVGYCGLQGQCDPFTGVGCSPQESCRFALRPDDQRLVTYCIAEGLAGEGEPCLESSEGAQGCGTGLICIGSGSGALTCRRTCDTGSYVAPCPEGQACRELLSRGPNLPIRGVGICVVNP